MFFKNSVASLRLFAITRTPVRHRSDRCSLSPEYPRRLKVYKILMEFNANLEWLYVNCQDNLIFFWGLPMVTTEKNNLHFFESVYNP